MLSILWALIPSRYLYTLGAASAALLLGWAALAHYGSARASSGYALGYTRARDSVWVAEMRKRVVLQDSLESVADRAAKAAQDGTTVLVPERAKFDSVVAQRRTPRIEALTVPVLVDTSLVGVFVENTGEHFVLPRRAAMYWQTSDSLVGVAQQLLKKYAAANVGWANAYTAEHEARVGADSLAALWRARALAVQPEHHQQGRMAKVWTWTERAALLSGAFYLGHRMR